jgi:hypothetical protein
LFDFVERNNTAALDQSEKIFGRLGGCRHEQFSAIF